ncbi:MAG TPA: response regulator transcription factor [Verrucomicrobiae bacterium]|nr:response regulator transcription factor [Verrucomicrobiae bacterium]
MTQEPPSIALSVLVVDDETQIQRLLTIALEATGYRVATAGTGQQALALIARQRHDLIILDLGLPDISGLLVLQQLREWTQTPVIILTVQDGEAEKVEALDSGADDYVTKPFNTAELLARLRAATRRSNQPRSRDPLFSFGELKVDLAARRVSFQGQPVKLTAKEYALLRLFVLHAGKVLTHRHILREVWGASHENDTQYLRVYLKRLREKLEPDHSARPLFLTEPGVGYRLAEGGTEEREPVGDS